MTYETITTDVAESGVATISMNRPDKLNAINPLMATELGDAVRSLSADAAVRVIVIRGEGRSFSAGADLKSKTEPAPVESLFERHLTAAGRHYWYIWDSPKPVIASVQGHCIAGAVLMVSLCDLTIASDDATFSFPTVAFNQHPGMPPFSAIMNMKAAKELTITGEAMTAQRAVEVGLANRVVPRADLERETLALAERIAALPAIGVSMHKRAVNRVYEAMGVHTVTDLGSELLTYANYIQASGGGDGGFRDRVREVGVAQATRERDARGSE